MTRHSGSARDPLNIEKSSTSSTPGMGWVLAGFVVIVLAVAFASATGAWLPDQIAHLTGSAAHG
jgi:hypothetical protein